VAQVRSEGGLLRSTCGAVLPVGPGGRLTGVEIGRSTGEEGQFVSGR
jgi:hypothetical protein